jgi:CubicO group peptidase (beta-lactamase class C family)
MIINGFGITVKTNESLETATNEIHVSFDRTISKIMKILKWPSLSLCFIKNDEVIWSNGYGFYDIENNKYASENTIYIIASITKTITGTALMQLYDQGLFDLDDDVNDYLPFSLRNPNFPDDPITFRMLLSHSSSLNYEQENIDGIKYYYWSNFSSNPPFSFYPYPWLEEHLIPNGKWYYSERWSKTYRPGERSMYANVNFDIIAYLVELISGESYLDYCTRYIFEPLEMYNTSFDLSTLDMDNIAFPYHYHNRKYLHITELSYYLGPYTPTYNYWRIRLYPVGGLYTTVLDLSHFLIAHMNNGKYNDVQILKEETVKEMHRIQPPGNRDGAYFGLAWLNDKIPFVEGIFSGHSGGILGVTTKMFYHPSDNIGIIYFTNGDCYWEQLKNIRLITALLAFSIIYNKASNVDGVEYE